MTATVRLIDGEVKTGELVNTFGEFSIIMLENMAVVSGVQCVGCEDLVYSQETDGNEICQTCFNSEIGKD